jgi:hypothetical protein
MAEILKKPADQWAVTTYFVLAQLAEADYVGESEILEQAVFLPFDASMGALYWLPNALDLEGHLEAEQR